MVPSLPPVLRSDFFEQVLGKRVGKAMAEIAKAVTQMGPEKIAEYEATGRVEVGGHVLQEGEVKACFCPC